MKETLVLPIDPSAIAGPAAQDALMRCARILRDGGTVAFPTETVYGLGANALDAAAVQKIFEAKKRPSWDPLIVHVADVGMLQRVARGVSATEQRLIDSYWPGPLSLLLPASEHLPPLVTAGRPKVGVRMPAHPVTHGLIVMAGVPIAAPSANSFGRISPTNAQHVLEDLDGRIDAILDGGATHLGLESTVLDAGAVPPTLYRHGMVSLEDLQRDIPDLIAFQETIEMTHAEPASLPSPGVGIRHYAPRAQLLLVDIDRVEKALCALVGRREGKSVGVMFPDGIRLQVPEGVVVERWGRWDHPDELAQHLFAGLRSLDARGVDVMVCPMPGKEGLGAALRDRLQKAARTAP